MKVNCTPRLTKFRISISNKQLVMGLSALCSRHGIHGINKISTLSMRDESTDLSGNDCGFSKSLGIKSKNVNF